MQRIKFVTHRDRRIIHVDCSGIVELPELEEVTQAATRAIRAEPPRSVLVLIDLTRVPYSLRMARQLAEVAASNATHVLARAVVGLADVAHPLVRQVAEYTGAALEAFTCQEDALEWLAEWPVATARPDHRHDRPAPDPEKP